MKRNTEFGRSMVEMIGVLALIGLLTTGGLALYSDALARLHVNNLLEEVRKRALVSSKKSSAHTYGMFDKSSAVSGVSAYGYGIADNKMTDSYQVLRERNGGALTVEGCEVVMVPVGALNGGSKISLKVCERLMAVTNEVKEGVCPVKGAMMGLFKGEACRQELTECTQEIDGEFFDDVPDVVCVAIKI